MTETRYGSQALIEQLKRHEGFIPKPYFCSEGKLSIGYGRDLVDVGIHKVEAHTLLVNDINRATAELFKALPEFSSLDLPRKNVLINMVYNMGLYRFLTFHHFIECLRAKDYEQAAREMLSSQWADQVGQRAKELAKQMHTNSFQ
jgi:lysozyme